MVTFVRKLSKEVRQRQELHLSLPKPKKFTRGYLEGMASEERFLRICHQFHADGEFPDWIQHFRRGTPAEDKQKIDAVVVTQEGLEIPVQIKSSEHGRLNFLRLGTHNHIFCIVITPTRSDYEIFVETAFEISMRRELLLMRAANY